MLREFAPAKINLYLHITGRGEDGYHALDSLTAFAGVGDEMRLEPAAKFDFLIEGPRSGPLQGEDVENNLAVKVARSLAAAKGKNLDFRLTLIKNLPVASGIGGGSSDAAATLRLLANHWGIAPDDADIKKAALTGGQDVGVCLVPETCYITEQGTADGPQLPHTDIVLVNPGKGLSTAEVYMGYRNGGFCFSEQARFSGNVIDCHDLASMLKKRTNDLAAPAFRLMPEIADIINAIDSSKDCLLARMSGSGATCFGLYLDRNSARAAASQILEAHPDWWVVQSYIPLRRDRRQRL